ncbi:MAG: FecR domain-containing protein [Kofleriaceae bacterium]
MKLRDQIKVEPLDEERLTNLERRLVVGVSELSMKRAPRRGLFVAASGVLAVAAAALLGWKLHAVPVVEPPAPATEHFAVAEGSQLLLDGATLGGNASYDVTRDPGRIVIVLKQGAMDFAVVHDPHRTLVVRAADTEIEDVGTKFHVDFDGRSGVSVRVTEGEVKVTRGANVVRVAAGSAWTTELGLVAIAALDPTPVPKPLPTPVVVAVADPHPVAAPVVTHPAAVHPVHHVEAAPTPIEHPLPTLAVDPYVELRTAILKVPLDFAPSIDGHADAANEIAKLKKVAYSSSTLGPEASQAMYQIAVLLYRPLGQDTEALRTLDMYTRRFNRGKELPAALWLRVRIECSHAFDEDCRRAAYSYQHDQTSGEASSVAIRITNAQ